MTDSDFTERPRIEARTLLWLIGARFLFATFKTVQQQTA